MIVVRLCTPPALGLLMSVVPLLDALAVVAVLTTWVTWALVVNPVAESVKLAVSSVVTSEVACWLTL